jgi:hypothetical protein
MKKKAKIFLILLTAIPVSLALAGYIGTAIYKPKDNG